MDVVNEFFKKGHLLTPEAVEFLKGKDITPYLQKEYKKLVLTKDDFIESVRIVKNLSYIPDKLTTETFLKFFNSKYEKMKKIFISRFGNEFVSINKIGRRGEVSVIGMIREIKRKEKTIVEIEDITGSISVVYDGSERLEEDDVVAVRGTAAGQVIYAKEILYPDVPLREPNTGKGKVLFLSNLELDETTPERIEKLQTLLDSGGFDYVVIVGNIGDVKTLEKMRFPKKTFLVPGKKDSKTYPSLPLNVNIENVVPLSNPAMIEINGVKILMITGFDMTMLRKRYLGKSHIILEEDYLVLDEVPDIVASDGEPNVKNYKSITIVNAGSFLSDVRPVIVDLKTREWKEVEGI